MLGKVAVVFVRRFAFPGNKRVPLWVRGRVVAYEKRKKWLQKEQTFNLMVAKPCKRSGSHVNNDKRTNGSIWKQKTVTETHERAIVIQFIEILAQSNFHSVVCSSLRLATIGRPVCTFARRFNKCEI